MPISSLGTIPTLDVTEIAGDQSGRMAIFGDTAIVRFWRRTRLRGMRVDRRWIVVLG